MFLYLTGKRDNAGHVKTTVNKTVIIVVSCYYSGFAQSYKDLYRVITMLEPLLIQSLFHEHQ